MSLLRVLEQTERIKYVKGRGKLLINYKRNYWLEVFVLSRRIKVEVGVINRSRRLRLITLTEILIILDITKT